jgi:phosphatidylserine synthase
MAFLAKLPAYAPFLFWATILLAVMTAFFVISGMRVNRGDIISSDPPTIAAISLAALVCASLEVLADPLVMLWIAFVAGLLATWGAAVDTNRRSDASGTQKKRPRPKPGKPPG